MNAGAASAGLELHGSAQLFVSSGKERNEWKWIRTSRRAAKLRDATLVAMADAWPWTSRSDDGSGAACRAANRGGGEVRAIL